MAIERICVPDIGDYTDIPVIELLVSEGDLVDAETGLCTLESDKATMEVPSPQSGTIKKWLIKLGDKVSQGTPILELEISASNDKDAPIPAAEPAPRISSASTADQQNRITPFPTSNLTATNCQCKLRNTSPRRTFSAKARTGVGRKSQQSFW